MSKRVTAADRDILQALVTKYGRAAIIKEIDATPRGKRGAPADLPGNAAAIYHCLEHYRHQPMQNGRKRGLAAARKYLRKLMQAYIVNCDVSDDQLRGMYDKMRKLGDRFSGPTMVCEVAPGVLIPLLLIEAEKGTGNYDSPIIDRFGGREPSEK